MFPMLIINIRVTQIIMLIVCVCFFSLSFRRAMHLSAGEKMQRTWYASRSVDMNDRHFGIGIRAQIEHTILMKSNSLDREYG